jgi:hypothetical protein
MTKCKRAKDRKKIPFESIYWHRNEKYENLIEGATSNTEDILKELFYIISNLHLMLFSYKPINTKC